MLFSRWSLIILIGSAIVIHEASCDHTIKFNLQDFTNKLKNAVRQVSHMYVSELAKDQLCGNQTTYLLDAFRNGKMWAVKG